MKKLGLFIASLILVNLSTWAQNEYPFKKEVQTDVPGVTETRYFDVRTGKYVSKKSLSVYMVYLHLHIMRTIK